MRFVIHAYPRRMWYVDDFLVPSLRAQGAEDIIVWNDYKGLGNLLSCVACFAAQTGDGGAWHIQDDVLVCRDFVKRCEELDDGLVYGFCNELNGDDPTMTGRVYMPDAWHGFPCVRVPNAWAREFADWFDYESQRPDLRGFRDIGKGDDWFFTQFLEERHGRDTAYNAKPCLVEHVDLLIGGSAVNEWRGYWIRAQWFDESLVDELRARLRM